MIKQFEVIYDRQWFDQEVKQDDVKARPLHHSKITGLNVKAGPLHRPLKWLGVGAIGLSLIGLLVFLSPLMAPKIAKPKKISFGDLVAQASPVPTSTISEVNKAASFATPQPKVENFLLTIEKIGLLNAPVISQVNSASQKEYEEALQKGLVQPSGSGFPGEGRIVYIYGHSTNYPWFVKDLNALLYQSEQLEVGDKVKIEYNAEHYLYYVFDKKVVGASDVSLIKANLDKDVLILQTCWPPGTWLKRLLIFCQPSKMGAII